jgi:hypothetical protein
MKNYFIAMFCIMLSVEARSQHTGSIKGKITDQLTKQPAAGITVLILHPVLAVVTDSAGFFSFTGLPEGNYSLSMSGTGFLQRTVNDVIVVRNKTYYFEAELLVVSKTLAEVEVKKIRNENNPLIPVSAFSLGREEIFRSPGAQGDIFRAIGILPGVTSSGGQFSAIAVRGQGVRDNVYMVDDIPAFEVSHLEGSGTFNDPNGGRFSIFAPRTIDNVLFQAGGFSAQFGRKSASYLGLGIKEGSKETPSLSGQFDLLGGTLIYDGPSRFNKKTTLFATTRYQNFYLIINKIVGLKNVGTPAYGDYMIKTTTQLNAKNKLSFLAMYNPESYVKKIAQVMESKQVEDISVGTTANDKALFGLNLRTLTGKKSYWKNVLYYRILNNRGTFGVSAPSVNAAGELVGKDSIPYETDLRQVRNNQHEIGYRTIYTRHFKTSSITAGVDLAKLYMDYSRRLKHTDTLYTFTQSDFRPVPSQYYLIVQPQQFNSEYKNDAFNVSGYVDYSFTLFKRLALNTGMRYDYTGFARQNTLSPRISGSLSLDGKSSIGFATGIYYQDPLLSDIADQPPANKLKCERTVQYILGYKNYFSEDLKLVAETWYKQFDHLTVRPQSGQIFLNNTGTGYAYGADISLTKRLSKKYYGQLAYSYMQSKRDDHDGLGRYNFTYNQPHILSILGSYQPDNKWVLSAKFRYATGRPKDSYFVHANIFNNPAYYRYSQEIRGKNTGRLNNFISFDIRTDYRIQIKKVSFTAFIDIVDVLNSYNQSAELFQPITGKTYYDGLAIFPSFGIRAEF